MSRAVRPLASEPRVDSPYLTTAEAARYLRYASPAALHKAIAHGTTNSYGERIPVLYRGRTLLFDRNALDAWLHEQKSAPVSIFPKGQNA